MQAPSSLSCSVLEYELEPKVYEFYSEKLRNEMRKREFETIKYLQEKLNKSKLNK